MGWGGMPRRFGRRWPLLRVSVAFLIGILLADGCALCLPSALTWVALAVAACFWVGALLLTSLDKGTHAHPTTGSVLLLAGVLCLGFYATQKRRDAVCVAWPDHPVDVRVSIESFPSARSRSWRYEAEVAGHALYLYLPADTVTPPYVPGDSLWLKGVTLRPPENFDGLTFDYARFLRHRGITGTVYVRADRVGPLPSSARSLRATTLRARLSDRYGRESLLDDEVQAVVRALTLGDRADLDGTLREAYAEAGVSHVLALSGLHVGIIYMLLSFLLRPLFRRRGLRWVQELLIVLAMWVFAFLTGLSPSIQRAVLMCTIYALAQAVSADRSPLDALALSALVLLVGDPYVLFDVGFELSFASMASILLLTGEVFAPHDDSLQRPTLWQRVGSYLGGIVVMSLSAQAGTLPLTLHYFAQFPTYFLLTNLLVIPMVYVTMLAAVVWWLCQLLPFAGCLPTDVLNLCVRFMNRVVTSVAALPGSVVEVPDFSWLQVIAAYGIVVSLLFFVKKKPAGMPCMWLFLALLLLCRLCGW